MFVAHVLRLRYKDQPVNSDWVRNRCLLTSMRHIHTLLRMQSFSMLKRVVHTEILWHVCSKQVLRSQRNSSS
jgi:hypothetical protein